MLVRIWETESLIQSWEECKNGTAILENILAGSLITNFATPIQTKNCALGHLPQRNENLHSQNPVLPFTKTCIQMFTAALFIITKNWKQPIFPPMSEGLNKWWYIHTTESCSGIKMNELLIDASIYVHLQRINYAECGKLIPKGNILHYSNRITFLK